MKLLQFILSLGLKKFSNIFNISKKILLNLIHFIACVCVLTINVASGLMCLSYDAMQSVICPEGFDVCAVSLTKKSF